jgi:hypothetical protein
MGITGQNKRKREAAEGRPGFLMSAETHFNNAKRRCEDLAAALKTAEQHLERCKSNLEAAKARVFDQLPPETKAMLKKQAAKSNKPAKKKTAKKAASKKAG